MSKKKILEQGELNIQSSCASFGATDLVFDAYANSKVAHGVKYSPIFLYLFYKKMEPFFQIIPQRIISEVSRNVYRDYCEDPQTLDDKMRRHKSLEQQLDKVWQNYQKDKLFDKEFFEAFLKISQEWWYYGAIGEDKGEVINQEIVPRFAKRHHLNLKEAREIMIILSFPRIQSIFNLERKDFLSICLACLDKKDLKKKLKEYIKKYFWFKTDFYEAVEITAELLLKEVQSEIKNRSKLLILKELKNIDKQFKKIHNQKKKLSLKLKLTKQDRKDIHFAELITYWFDQRKLKMMIQLYYLFSFINDVAQKNNLTYHELTAYRVGELEDFLKNKKKISKKEIENRGKGVFYIYEEGKEAKAFYDKEAKEMFVIATHVKNKGLKGHVASTGGLKKIKGRVNIVLYPKKEKFKQGQILVTSMTRIEFISLMRKAKAVITNEGGIACHAAIVSRELGIPSIIGTKNATKVLKTGDIVELDLKTGIVKIIKKAK